MQHYTDTTNVRFWDRFTGENKKNGENRDANDNRLVNNQQPVTPFGSIHCFLLL